MEEAQFSNLNPSEMSLKFQEIKEVYQDRLSIFSKREDSSLECRLKVLQLKDESILLIKLTVNQS